jgi:HEAT repeat protein
MATRRTVEEKLSELEAAAADVDRNAQCTAIGSALADKHYRLVAKAARLAADALLYELTPALLAAYPRFLEQPVKRDPNCLAKKAIARALVALDCEDTEFFRRGLRYRQPEPVWGGTVDTAVDIRCSCAMGLVASGSPRALADLCELLADPEVDARAGAARAIACGTPREAELLLRAKAVCGDAEPQVIGACFIGLFSVEPDESVEFVARYLDDRDDAISEAAALALGESRQEAALDRLKIAWDGVLLKPGFRRSLIRAAAIHRSDRAFDWLVSLVDEADRRLADDVIEILAVYKHNDKLAQRLSAAVEARGDDVLRSRFAELWK